eukprot:7323168-Ditylum_brightwellii.AAC.1
MILKLLKSPNIQTDYFVNADFVGLWRTEDDQDSNCIKSHTGYMIMVFDCLVLCSSKFQTIIVQSTIKSKYVALSVACCDLLPLKQLLKEVIRTLGITKETKCIHTTI